MTDLDSALDYIRIYSEQQSSDLCSKRAYEHCWDIINYYRQQEFKKPVKVSERKEFIEKYIKQKEYN